MERIQSACRRREENILLCVNIRKQFDALGHSGGRSDGEETCCLVRKCNVILDNSCTKQREQTSTTLKKKEGKQLPGCAPTVPETSCHLTSGALGSNLTRDRT